MAGAIPEHLLLDEATLDAPYGFYRRLAVEAPVWRASEDIFAVSSHALIVEASRRVDDFSSNMKYLLYRDDNGAPRRIEHGFPDLQILATADPPHHARHRQVMLPAFSPGRLVALEQTISALSSSLVVNALSEGATEFMQSVANRLPMEIVVNLADFRDADPDVLLQAAFASTDILAGAVSRAALEQRSTVSMRTSAWIASQMQSALEQPRGGILGELARAVHDGKIEHVAAFAILHILLSAGGESTTGLVGNAVQMLAHDADLQAELRRDPSRIPAFVEEVLRLEAPFRYHMRWTPKATTLGSVEIPAGATVLLMWGAANRDPAAFDNPDAVMLDRPRRHVTFGSGIHMCIGNALARLEARLVLQTLLALTSRIEPDPAGPAKRVTSLAVRRFEKLPVVLSAA